MRKKMNFISFFSVLVVLLLIDSQCNAFNYTIRFTASGSTNSVGSVVVKNLTKGTIATVPDGNTLTLTDQLSAVNAPSSNNGNIQISQNTSTGTFTLTFYARQCGNTQVAAFGLDGRKVVGLTTHLDAGDNSLELSLPADIYVIRVSGAGYSYSTKLRSQTSAVTQARIKLLAQTKVDLYKLQRSKVGQTTTTMIYTTGDRILYTAFSSIYIASIPDVPTNGKTVNFNFATIPTSAIPAGTFSMGSPGTEVKRMTTETQHTVTLSAFRISKYEITNKQYADFLNTKSIGVNGSYATKNYGTQVLIYESSGSNDWGLHFNGSQWVPVSDYENNPVINITWYGAVEYATYIGGTLPTESQWEYACRAGTTTPFNTGDFLTNLQANYNWALPYNNGTNTVTIYPATTQPIGCYDANAFGLYDMHGNVWEWCSDWYGTYSTTPQTDPTGPVIGTYRVVRGGGWKTVAQESRSASRGSITPNTYYNMYGFRVVFLP